MKYQEIVSDGTVTKQADIILQLLLNSSPLSLREIQQKTKIEINAVSGRVNDLKKNGEVLESEKRKCSISGRSITPVTTALGLILQKWEKKDGASEGSYNLRDTLINNQQHFI